MLTDKYLNEHSQCNKRLVSSLSINGLINFRRRKNSWGTLPYFLSFLLWILVPRTDDGVVFTESSCLLRLFNHSPFQLLNISIRCGPEWHPLSRKQSLAMTLLIKFKKISSDKGNSFEDIFSYFEWSHDSLSALPIPPFVSAFSLNVSNAELLHLVHPFAYSIIYMTLLRWFFLVTRPSYH